MSHLCPDDRGKTLHPWKDAYLRKVPCHVFSIVDYWTDSFVWRIIHRYMLILTQTKTKQISCQIFTNTAAGFHRTTASSCWWEFDKKFVFLFLSVKINMYLWFLVLFYSIMVKFQTYRAFVSMAQTFLIVLSLCVMWCGFLVLLSSRWPICVLCEVIIQVVKGVICRIIRKWEASVTVIIVMDNVNITKLRLWSIDLETPPIDKQVSSRFRSFVFS